jgi:hypothetical protein
LFAHIIRTFNRDSRVRLTRIPIHPACLAICVAACATSATSGETTPELAPTTITSASAAGTVGERVAAAGPGPRSAHVMTYHGGLEQVLLLGGVDPSQDGGVWTLDGGSWQRVGSDSGPGSRGHFALAYDSARALLLLHGGTSLRFGENVGEAGRHGDLWSWDGRTWSMINGTAIGPSMRDHHAMVYDAARQRTVLFGGGRGIAGNQALLDDTWLFDGTRWTRHAGANPPARATHRLVYDSHRERVVLFGGWGADGLLNDTWEWDGTAWTMMSSTGPSPRFATRIAYDERRQRVVLFGGRDSSGDLADTWTWDGTTWTRVATAGPPVRNVHGLAYDRRRERVVLYGGFHSPERLQDTWTWDGARWEEVR